jgi:cytochrome c biogenesis protein CcmG/thiol:disulfide interchange protein DsbE
MPSVQRVHNEFQDQEVVMLAISVDGGGPKAVQTFLEKHGYTMPTAVDAGMKVARKFGVRGVPTTYLVSRQGVVIASSFGPVDFDHPAFRAFDLCR